VQTSVRINRPVAISWRNAMRTIATCALLAVFAVGLPSDASAIACKGRTDWRTGPNGGIQVCLDGTYATCVRDARDRLGWGAAGARRCDDLRSQDRVK
jgi:hypothetical protein